MEKTYMIVTADKYELPILITNNINDLAKYAGRTKKSIKAALNYKSVDRNLKVKYVRVEHKKYYLKHKFLDREGVNYLNYNYSTDRLYIIGRTETRYYQTEFTDEEIEKIEASGFDLCNFEKVEVENENLRN